MDNWKGADAMRAALANEIVIRNIFSYLSLDNLKQCRIVCRKWNSKICSYIRCFRQCNANIEKLEPCWVLKELNKVVGRMTTTLPINSLSINLGPHDKLTCTSVCKKITKDTKSGSKVYYGELLEKLSLKYLSIFWDMSFSCKNCPAVKFIITLLRKKIQQLEYLYLDCVPGTDLCELDTDWSPVFPKLKVFYVGENYLWAWDDSIVSKIISGAPNLKKLKGIFDTSTVQRVHMLSREINTICWTPYTSGFRPLSKQRSA